MRAPVGVLLEFCGLFGIWPYWLVLWGVGLWFSGWFVSGACGLWFIRLVVAGLWLRLLWLLCYWH